MGYLRKTFVYGLREVGGRIRYVGKTDFSLKRRLQQHLGVARRGELQNWPVYQWLAECLEQHVKIEIVLLATVEPGCDIDFWLTGHEVEASLVQAAEDYYQLNGLPPVLNVVYSAKHLQPTGGDK